MIDEKKKGFNRLLVTEKAPASTEQKAVAKDLAAKNRPRSPGYPGIDLKKAIDRAKTLYVQQNRYEAAGETILQHWGYKPRTGPGLSTLAALKAFRLLEAGEAGRFKLSRLAIDIILDERKGPERLDAIRKAALSPTIHKVMWEKYGGVLPSDANLRFFLRTERQFTEDGATQFIAQYRATLVFADLLGDRKLSEPEEDPDQEVPPVPNTQGVISPLPPAPPVGSVLEIPIPIAGAAWPALKAAFPMSEAAWDQMLEVLKAMRPGLVRIAERAALTDDESKN